MYFPYLRARQFELIALRELVAESVLDKIMPVLEPVKDSFNNLNLANKTLYFCTKTDNFTIKFFGIPYQTENHLKPRPFISINTDSKSLLNETIHRIKNEFKLYKPTFSFHFSCFRH